MKKFGCILLFLVAYSSQLISQQYGNEWISTNQRYYKFPITQTGIHHINYNDLSQGFASLGLDDIDNIDPRFIQVFGRGQQQYIHIEGEADFSFDPGDYIEFFAQKNDGWADSLLYGSANEVTNPYYSNFSDTIYYYISIADTTGNLRLENNSGFNPNPSNLQDYFLKESYQSYTNNYYEGSALSKHDPNYTLGEGWMSGTFYEDQAPFSITLQSPNIFSGAGAPQTDLSYFVIGRNNIPKNLNVSINGSTLLDTTISGDHYIHGQQQVAVQNNASQNLVFTLAQDNSSNRQYMSVSYASLIYPHSYTFSSTQSSLLFEMPNNGLSSYYVSFDGFSNLQCSYIYDLTDHRRVQTQLVNGNIEAVIPPSNNNENKQCYITNDIEIISISNISPVNATASFTDHSSEFPDSAFVIVSNKVLESSVSDYANYKTSIGHDVYVFYMQDIMHQFGFGIPNHPNAIKNLMKYYWDSWSEHPKHLFIIGKSVMDGSQSFRNDPSVGGLNLIPSYSVPPNDFNFVAGLDGVENLPEIPVGRLAAVNNTQVLNYLDKISAHEQSLLEYELDGQVVNELWHKRFMHFGGGEDEDEQEDFRTYLNNYEYTIENGDYAAEVYEFYKSTTDAIEFNVADSIKDIINEGVALLTFFGHSSTSSFDINIDNAASYNNLNRYFFLLSNGCFAGDIHQANTESLSEDFVLIKDKGAIGFIAQADLGIPDALDIQSSEFYDRLANENYGQPVGKILQEAVKANMLEFPTSTITRVTGFEAIYHGDPSMRMTANYQTDYALIRPENVFFNPTTVSTAIDSFSINIVCSNLGVSHPDQVTFTVLRTRPNGPDTTYSFTVNPIQYQDTVSLTIPVDGGVSVGNNTFTISVDPFNFVDEKSEINNNIEPGSGVASLLITSEELVPVYPYDYAVVQDLNFSLKASTANPLADNEDYIIQLDTTDLYNSSALQQTTSSSVGGVVEWQPTFPINSDSIVYYWRCSPSHLNPDSLEWLEHSFQYVNGQKGWGQDHFFQHKNNGYNQIKYNRSDRSLTYDTTGASLFVQVIGDQQPGNDLSGTEYRLNGIRQTQGTCFYIPKFHVVVIDPLTLKPWETVQVVNGDTINYPEFDFGQDNTGLANSCFSSFPNHQKQMFAFGTGGFPTWQTQVDSLVSMLNNKIPDGHYVMIYTVVKPQYQSNTYLSTSGLKTALNNLGSFALDTLPDERPWIFFVKKGDLSTAREVVGNVIDTTITIQESLDGTADLGYVESPLIGPSFQWNSLYWNFTSTEGQNSDTLQLEVLSPSNQVLASYSTLTGQDLSLSSQINALQYPYVKLRAQLKDELYAYPAQHMQWHLLYSQAPEAAVNLKEGFYMSADSVSQGDSLLLAVAIENISEVNMDSLQVSYSVLSSAGQLFPVHYPTQDSLRIGEILLDTIKIPTGTLQGFNQVQVEVNPKDSLWQNEQYHFNNIVSLPFKVLVDNINPILDVTFDGVHILDGDIVSPESSILISLNDNNLNKLLDEVSDTANFQMSLTSPDGQEIPVYFANTSEDYTIDYSLANSNDQAFKIHLNPTLTQNGIYALKVQAWDKSGNKAGEIDYEISFEVVLESSITNVLNYPNPFSTNTRFVFTLTGAEIPEVFKIQIMTVTGKIVREIFKEELGSIRIGRNITDFAWDGTDKYGDRLANGVYLYRVITSISGEEIERRQSNADQYFKHSFGKMYLLR